MKRVLSLLFAVVFLFPAGESWAASSLSSLTSWFHNVKMGLKKSVVSARYRKVRVTAVAAVRGDKQYWGPEKPYWKGTWSEKKNAVIDKEKAELEAAVDLILDGKLDAGAAKLDAFEKTYPKSGMRGDVKDIRAKLVELRAESTPAAPAPKAASEKTPEKPSNDAVEKAAEKPAASKEETAGKKGE